MKSTRLKYVGGHHGNRYAHLWVVVHGDSLCWRDSPTTDWSSKPALSTNGMQRTALCALLPLMLKPLADTHTVPKDTDVP